MLTVLVFTISFTYGVYKKVKQQADKELAAAIRKGCIESSSLNINR